MEIKEIQATIEKLKEISTSFFSSAKKVCGKKNDDNGWPMHSAGRWDKIEK